MPEIGVSLCMTVKNEAHVLDRLAADLRAQTVKPDEIVVTDGGSTDGTVERLREVLGEFEEVRVIAMPGANIAAGRNRAIAEARGEVVLVADAGLRLPPRWVEGLSAAVREEGVDVAFGYVLSEPENDFEFALAAVTRPLKEEIDSGTYPVSGGCAGFRAELFTRYQYPEWLDYGEDMHLYLRWRRDGVGMVHVAAADAGFRPRPDVGAFFRQYFNYARGDGEAGMWGARHGLRAGAYAVLVVAVGNALLGSSWRLGPILLGGLLGLAYLRRPWRRLLATTPGWGARRRARAVGWLTVIRLVGDMAKLSGYVYGRMRRGGGR
jgi:glycosyltransferase involved in cell wall biosynthesis